MQLITDLSTKEVHSVKKENSKLIYVLLFCVFINYLNFMNVAAFLPIFVEKNYPIITSL